MIRRFITIVKENIKYINLTTVIFIASAVGGYLFFNEDNPYIKALFKELETIASDIKAKDSVIYMIYTIFVNNLSVALRMLLLGLLTFGIIPLLIIFGNGMFIGFLLKKLILETGQSVSFFLVGILPHGILELPAIVFAAAIGIKLGTYLFKYIGSLFTKKDVEYNKLSLLHTIKMVPSIVLSLIFVLFVAAVIESTVTGYLLSQF